MNKSLSEQVGELADDFEKAQNIIDSLQGNFEKILDSKDEDILELKDEIIALKKIECEACRALRKLKE